MPLFGTSPLLGLDIGSSMVKAVALQKKNGRVVVVRAAISAVPGGAISEGAVFDAPAVSAFIRKFCRGQRLGGGRLAVAVAGDGVFLTRLKLMRTGGGSWRSRVEQEAAHVLPFPPGDANLDYQLLEELPEAAEALLVAARRDRINGLRAMLRRAGTHPVVVEAAACAVANSLEFNYAPEKSAIAALLHVGAATMTVCIVCGSAPIVARDLSLSHGGLTGEEWPLVDRVAVQLERVFEELDDLADEQPLEPRSSSIGRIWLSGGAARVPGFHEALRRRFGLPVEEMNPFRKMEFDDSGATGRLVRDHSHCMSVAVGLALRGLDS